MNEVIDPAGLGTTPGDLTSQHDAPTDTTGHTPADRLCDLAVEILAMRIPVTTVLDEFGEEIAAAGTSDDPRLRLASAYYRLWDNEYRVRGAEQRDRTFHRLTREVAELKQAGTRIDTPTATLLETVLSDIWMVRGNIDTARRHAREAHRCAKQVGNPAMADITLASLGFLTCMAGYISDGISIVLRSTSNTIDIEREQFICHSDERRSEVRTAFELADCYEYTRNWRRAATLLRIINTRLSPGDPVRAHNLWALVRCYSKLGELEMAREVMAQAPAPDPSLGFSTSAKFERTRIVYLAADGHTTDALDACDELLAQVSAPNRLSIGKEIADEGALIARRADEPYACLRLLERFERRDPNFCSLLDTLAHDSLAWAYRRIGRRQLARHHRHGAAAGQRRFAGRAGNSQFDRSGLPVAVINGRENHRRARLAQLDEQRSLSRGIDAVAHDLRGPLQSLEFAFSVADVSTDVRTETIVDSIDTTLDELLRDIDVLPAAELTAVTLADIVADVTATFRSAADRKRILLSADVGTNLVCTANIAMLGRVISNLTSNAIKYSPTGGEVHISASTLGHSIINLHVEDSGPGVLADELPELFQWGGTGSAVPTAGETSHGIGLYTTKRLATLLGATVHCHPRTGNARSAFTVRLQRAPVLAERR